jgi:flagellar motility protein MotE (MotC chaperone)
MTSPRKPNIFMILMIVAATGFVLRLSAIVIPALAVDAETAAAGGEMAKPVDEQPPPLTQEDIEEGVKATAKAAEDLPGGAAPPPAAVVPGANAPAPYGERAFSSSEVEVLQSLSKRRAEIDKREEALSQREALLKAASLEVDRKVTELNKLKGEIEDLLGKQQQMQEERLASLVKIYEAMKPKEAARIFDTLEMDVLLAVVGRMNERKLSPVLASMDPEKARLVTIQLAEQRKLPSLEEALPKEGAKE